MKRQLKDPNFAGITIKYGKKPKINFRYRTKHSLKKSIYNSIFFEYSYKISLLILTISAILFFFLDDLQFAFTLLLIVLLLPLSLLLGVNYYYNNEEALKNLPKKVAKWNKNNLQFVEVKKLDSKEYLIPLFNNIYFSYETKKGSDFDKYLKEIEIDTYPFKYYKKTKFGKEEGKNTDYWFAKFKFSKIPKKGWLKVKYI